MIKEYKINAADASNRDMHGSAKLFDLVVELANDLLTMYGVNDRLARCDAHIARQLAESMQTNARLQKELAGRNA